MANKCSKCSIELPPGKYICADCLAKKDAMSPTVRTLLLLAGGLVVLVPLSMALAKDAGSAVQFVFMGLGAIAIIDQGIRKGWK